MTTLNELYEAFQELCDEGMLVKKLDDKGQPVLKLDSAVELQPVVIHFRYATPEELSFWRNEHPGLIPSWTIN